MLPILMAEFTVMLGFGALLPVLPLYVQDQGIDTATLGLIMAAWAVGKLIFEPVFGWWADRHARKPQMVVALVLMSISIIAMLFVTTTAALLVLRFLSGISAGMYDPAARGMLVQGTNEDERGEAFGIYGAFQIGGFVFGPAIGAFAVTLLGGFAFPFIFTAALSIVAAALLFLRLPEHPHVLEDERFEHHPDAQPLPAGVPFAASETVGVPEEPRSKQKQAPLSALWNRTLIAAFVLQFGLHLSFGVYEVVWTLYLMALGATIGWVGFTFMLFAIPEMIISPIAGRFVDRRGPLRLIIPGGVIVLLSGVLYAIATEPIMPTLVVPVQSAAAALIMPALYLMVANGTPEGRTSTVQGLFGAVGTLALIVASLVAGLLFDQGIGLPFWFFVGGFAICFVVALLVLRGARTSATRRPTADAAA
jgi:MFS family permease